jgi:hypothetical protein
MERGATIEKKMAVMDSICQRCCQAPAAGGVPCVALDCLLLFDRQRTVREREAFYRGDFAEFLAMAGPTAELDF